jgi:hypothetical protein
MIYLLCLIAEATGLVGASGPGEADDGRLLPGRVGGGAAGGAALGGGREGREEALGQLLEEEREEVRLLLGHAEDRWIYRAAAMAETERGGRRGEERTCVVMNGLTRGVSSCSDGRGPPPPTFFSPAQMASSNSIGRISAVAKSDSGVQEETCCGEVRFWLQEEMLVELGTSLIIIYGYRGGG